MIKAYHHVDQFPLERILEKGGIFPVAWRVDPEVVRAECDGEINELREMVLDEDGNPIAVQGVTLLMEERVREISAASTRETEETWLFCGDFLAGDAFSVFLSAGQWGRSEGETIVPNGFVFDAEDLIKNRGVLVRPADLLGSYIGILDEVPWMEVDSPQEACDEIARQLLMAKKEHELKGREALSYLRKNPKEWHELLSPGPLNIDLAVEMWDDGVLIPRVTT